MLWPLRLWQFPKELFSHVNIFFADIVKEHDNDVEFSAVFQRLMEEDFPDLPPGGGIHSK